MAEFTQLPDDLPVPVDDGAADHLPGRRMPPVHLPSTAGETVALDELGQGRTVLYIYPMTGRPGVELPEGWDREKGRVARLASAPVSTVGPERKARGWTQQQLAIQSG
jgi:hypothetical protein